jgi:DNA-binding CsgD family transcriptional regulator
MGTQWPGGRTGAAAHCALDDARRVRLAFTAVATFYRAFAPTLGKKDARAMAEKVLAPTLVLPSEGDAVVPLALGHELAAGIPGARFEMLRSRNHLPLPQEPAFERMCHVITEFVALKPPQHLTPRERELCGLVGQGLDNLQIAARLGLADKTVRNMLSALYTKLEVEGRAMAVVKVRDMGL